MSDRVVHLVDDDPAVRKSIAFMLKTAGYQVRVYESGLEFLKAAKGAEPGCILLDIRMPAMDGLETQQALLDCGIVFPVIMMTGHGDVPLSVQAMRAGAVDFIEKPFEKSILIAAIEESFSRLGRTAGSQQRASDARNRLQILSPRERQVLNGLADGLPNKTIAYDLGISARTVEIHRANLMAKLEARSLSDVLRLAFLASEYSEPS